MGLSPLWVLKMKFSGEEEAGRVTCGWQECPWHPKQACGKGRLPFGRDQTAVQPARMRAGADHLPLNSTEGPSRWTMGPEAGSLPQRWLWPSGEACGCDLKLTSIPTSPCGPAFQLPEAEGS